MSTAHTLVLLVAAQIKARLHYFHIITKPIAFILIKQKNLGKPNA